MTASTHLLLAALAATLLATAGCGGPGDDAPDTTITAQEADVRLEARIREITAAIPAHQLESLNPGRDSNGRPLVEPLIAHCGGLIGGGPEDGRVTLSRSYWLSDVPADRADAAVQTALDYMTAHGYDVSTRNLDRGIVRANAPDGTTGLIIQRTPSGDVTIGADSICVWPDGSRPAR